MIVQQNWRIVHRGKSYCRTSSLENADMKQTHTHKVTFQLALIITITLIDNHRQHSLNADLCQRWKKMIHI